MFQLPIMFISTSEQIQEKVINIYFRVNYPLYFMNATHLQTFYKMKLLSHTDFPNEIFHFKKR